ncbi:hypothetical protein CY34DRAFT_430292 [Suillus luteus UH-Slu-Lm8-n1]|uniref:Uncharacterized protein n=1 Tax=Suillus luteus UH-Slu-Lm8-n1 TaxID=930992 RepID=A0A0D0C297_9AGAM|nr:hypothetical protein CY34DRAFT_430292 [Suillus luteus UH-Slu-Lm8-n1]
MFRANAVVLGHPLDNSRIASLIYLSRIISLSDCIAVLVGFSQFHNMTFLQNLIFTPLSSSLVHQAYVESEQTLLNLCITEALSTCIPPACRHNWLFSIRHHAQEQKATLLTSCRTRRWSTTSRCGKQGLQ